MKALDSDLAAVYQSDTPTIAPCVVVTRTDGQIFRWIGLDRNLTIEGDLFLSAPGVQFSAIVSTEGFAVDNAEVTILEDADITRADILAGVWNGARMTLAECDWSSPAPVLNVLKEGTLGVVRPMRGHSIVEFRDLRNIIQGEDQTVLQPNCRYVLGDSKCGVDLPSLAENGTVTSVQSLYGVTDSARAEAADYFGEGVFTFTDGENAGHSRKIKTFAAGVFVFWQQFIYPIDVGAAYSVTPGCRLRFREDCITKFDNGINFGGEPNKLNPDALVAPAE